MEITTSEKGESSRANYPEPIREFTEEERNNIKKQVTIYAGEAEKLKEEAQRGSTSCIYRVLPQLKESNGDSLYEPNKVSIGPYYYKLRNEKFKMAEDCKKKCFGSMLVKTTDQDMQINTYLSCLQRISKLEEKIRKCYSEEFEVAGIEFLQMMVVDACFIIEIIEIFRFMNIDVKYRESDLGAFAWMVPYFYRDFLLLENQIPFFVLEEIYALIHNIPVEESTIPLRLDALRFFKNGMKGYFFIRRDIPAMDGVPVSHLLDLVRRSLIPFNIGPRRVGFVRSPFIHCISKLQLAGIKVSPVRADSFLEVKFKKGVLEMPNIAVDDLTRCLLLNCVAFEQCQQRSGRYFSVYATFLHGLVNTKEDIEYLRERKVIDNYLTDDSELAGFINRAGKDLVLDYYDGVYVMGELFMDVDRHYRNRWKWKWASFEREYIDKPWLLLSAAGGILLVVATSVQAVMAILSYKYKNC
ncbi:hypothetical protein I3842_16G039500 [Carya illinoinensis]|uniref:Uncharacterized protein n=1 Tax=Carya illinoinensis TaxID=32201 RepID=A0A922A4Z4_CARIL|nr:hypothetical protein I3842_16G039500 [Carya illinoinensis]KAG6672084.1 hypothetical protein I3842_16G039500 [Carya illinoinensis]